MTNCLVLVTVLALGFGMLFAVLGKRNTEYGRQTAIVSLCAFAVFLVLGIVVVPIVKYNEAQGNALVCLAKEYGASAKIVVDEPVCSTTTRYLCETWKSSYKAGDARGTILFDNNSCVLDKK